MATLCGRGGKTGQADATRAGWRGPAADPNSPVGGGGPGRFQPSGPVGTRVDDKPRVGEVASDRPRADVRGALSGSTTPSAVPPQGTAATTAESLGVLKKVQAEWVDVEVSGEILADGELLAADAPAETKCEMPSWTHPSYEMDANGKIQNFLGKFVWRGTVSIRTSYESQSSARQLSGYGRGTTREDVSQGNITLAFHELCHRLDYRNYLQSHPLPDPPSLKTGMKAKDFDAAIEKFRKAFQKYEKDLTASSWKRTDEVGHKKSTWRRTGKAYEHAPR